MKINKIAFCLYCVKDRIRLLEASFNSFNEWKKEQNSSDGDINKNAKTVYPLEYTCVWNKN